MGNIKTVTYSNGVTESYAYDSLNRLVTANIGNDTYRYTYDNSGNILSKTKNNSTVAYTYGTSAVNPAWGDLLTAYNGTAINYDKIGNPISYGNCSFTWNGRRMATFSDGTTTTSYKYNEDGVRTSKTVGDATTYFFVDGTTILAQKTGNTTIPYYYDGNGKRIAFKYDDELYFYVYNLQGDVTHILDFDGDIVGEYKYDAWGKITNLSSLTSIARQNPFRYRGYYYDTESGLYYLNSRYYNPEWGRFLNADGYVSTGQGLTGYNLFAYCGNNPVNNIDPNGDCPYNGTAADFHRLEQGLPSLDCTCTEYEYFAYSEHKKKGTTNPANKENHQNAEARRKRDKRGEKGDARRKDYSNKRKNNINIEINTEVITTVCYGAVAIGGSVAIIYIVVNNVTGVGIMDDVAIAPITKVVWDSASKAFA